MPWVTIRTGVLAEDGREQILKEYQCDAIGCANIAEHVLAVVRGVGSYAVCPEHAVGPSNSPSEILPPGISDRK